MTTYTYVTFDDPLGTGNTGIPRFGLPVDGTLVAGVSPTTGIIVGGFIDGNGNPHGFSYDGSTYTTVDAPQAAFGTVVWDINDSGQMVGTYSDINHSSVSFLDSAGQFTTINDPSGFVTFVSALNNAGQVVGMYEDPTSTWGFLYSNGTYTTISDPLADHTQVGGTIPMGINSHGDVVGIYLDSKGTPHGFLLSGGAYTTIDDPLGVNGTVVRAINDSGQIVGGYVDANQISHGFLFSNGTFTTIDDPSGVQGSIATGIADSGKIIGSYVDGSGLDHGFAAVPSGDPTTEIAQIFQSVLQRQPTSSELSSQLALSSSSGIAAVVANVVDSSEAQFNVYPICQIINLAIGSFPTPHQLAGWVPFIEQNGLLQGQAQTNPLLDQMALAFVASDNFGKVYNNGVDVDPNSPVTSQEIKVIINAATGVPATQAQIDSWVGTGLSIDQVFVDFSLGDQYTEASKAANQQFLTTTADNAAGVQVAAIIGSSDAVTHA